MVSVEKEIQNSIGKAIRDAEMEMAKKNFIYDITNNKRIEKGKHSEEMEKCVEELVRKLQGGTINIDTSNKIIEENKRLKENLSRLEETSDTLKINSKDDIETVKDV